MLIQIKEWMVRRLAENYIAGPHLTDALRLCRRIFARGWGSILCPWDGPGDTPEEVLSNYQTALQTIAAEKLDAHLSIKAPSLRYDFELLKRLIDPAAERGARIHFDAQDFHAATPTFRLLERAVQYYPNIGCTLPSRWRRSCFDAERAIAFRVPVRVVKGEWPDPTGEAIDPKARFLDLIDRLAGRAREVAVATHDPVLARAALARLQKSGTPCRLEQLWGLPLRAKAVAEPMGVPVRVYIPYGHAWLPYCMGAIRRRPIILAWAARDFFLTRRSL